MPMSLPVRLVIVASVVAALVMGVLAPHLGSSSALTAGGYSTSASITPDPVPPGTTAAISASVTNDTASAVTVLVDIEIRDSAGNRFFQTFFDNQSFGAAATRTYQASWAVPSTAAPGAYRVQVGVFQPGWASTLHWNDAAAPFTVGAATTTTMTAPTTTASTTTTTAPAGSGNLPPLPANWPRGLQLGMTDPPGDASAMKATTGAAFRYQYLTGGVNTGGGWATWNPDGQFVTSYVRESQASNVTPVFTYYQLLPSWPGKSQPEPTSDYTNLANTATMAAYFEDVTLFFQRAAGSTPVVLQVEPDLWGHVQQAAQHNDPATVAVQVSSTGLADLAGLPNNAAGLAQAFVRLRDRYAPNVELGYSFSGWSSGTDILYAKPPDATVSALGAQTGAFYRALSANFDIAFTDLTDGDRDAAFRQFVNGDGGASWYQPDDYRRSAEYIAGFVGVAQKRVVLWQIPLGNTTMRAENDTWNHFQDNKVQWLLGDPTRVHLEDYANAGVVAFLFGRGADGNTCACDAAGDGITNPAPVNGNVGVSVSADDDGGYFRQQASAYDAGGPLPLPS
jgi:hypothetical protein